jgi:hypothetical protein
VKRPSLGARDRRAVLLGGGVLLAAWLAARGVPRLLHGYASLRARTEASAHQLAAAREALAEAPFVRDSLSVRAQRLVAWAPRLVAGRTPAEAAADLASLVTGLAAQLRVRVARMDPLPDSAGAVFARVGLRIEVQGDIGGIARWLSSLEEGDRLLAVRTISVMAPEPAAPATQAEALRAELTIVGWAAPRAPGRE